MNSIHDMGGMHGMGPVEIEADEPVFHAEWEQRIFALRLATAFHRNTMTNSEGGTNDEEFRN